MLKVLFLAANPTDTQTLNLGEEIREIRQRIRVAEDRDIIMEQEWAVRLKDLFNSLPSYKPDVVHFSGHGTQAGEIVLMDEGGTGQPVDPTTLADLFRLLHGNVRCVVLNACFSRLQAGGISQEVDFVVGMESGVQDSAAIEFAAAFYQALANGQNVQSSFDLGRTAMRAYGAAQALVPQLLARKANPGKSYLTYSPEILCEFRLRSDGRPRVRKGVYDARAWIRNPPVDTYQTVYQLTREFHGRDEFSTVDWKEPDLELDFLCPYDFELRATLWRAKHDGIGLKTKVADALAKRYQRRCPQPIREAIQNLRDNAIEQ
jgi:hypothetical protein